jgi:hypothetical protein
MPLRIAAVALLIASTLAASDEVRCRSRVVFPGTTHVVTIPFERTRNGVFVRARVNGQPEPLWFVIDSGAARTVISDTAAKRAGLNATERAIISGTGMGAIPVTVARNVTVSVDTVSIERIDARIAKLAALTPAWGRPVDGILGFDLLCHSVLTVDYDSKKMTIAHPAVFRYDGSGEILPLTIRGGWSFVEGTIKVTGRPAVIDNFLIDSGSQDAVNHPIIRDSKGPLRKVNTGVGLGTALAGVLGPNEWFKLGRYTIGSTQSACCAASEEVSRQIGAEVLSRFRVTFDYPHHRMILERSTR